MIRLRHLWPALLGASACASTGAPTDTIAATARPVRAVAVDAALHPEGRSPTPQPERDPELTSEELDLWRDASFRKRFAESFLAETDIEPRVTSLEREVMLEVLELISAERVDEALALVEKNAGPEASAVFDFTEANLLYRREEFDGAGDAFRRAVDKHPKYRRAWQGLGEVRYRQGDHAEAREALTHVLQLGAVDAVTYGVLGACNASLGDYLSAESAFRMAALLEPKRLDWQRGLVDALFRQERYADTASLCDTLIAGHPSSARLWLVQADAYRGLGRMEDAIENLEVVDRLGGSTPDSLNLLGDIYVNEELYDRAGDAYLRALGDGSAGFARAVINARVLGERGALAEAGRLADRIDELCGDELDENARKSLLKLRARLAVAAGAGEEEVRLLEQIVELDPLDGEALLLLAQSAEQSQELEKAAFYYEQAAGIERYEADAKTRHGQLLVRQERYAEALPLLRRAQALAPREALQVYVEQVERIAQTR